MREIAEAKGRGFNWFTPGRFALLLAALVFASFPQVLLGLQTFVVRDFGFFAYPVAHFQQDCFRRGQLPFWDPYNNCGVPFLAQWNTMPLYPPSLIYLLLPLGWSLGFFCLLHLWSAGFGMYWLARRWTGNNFAAAFAGVAFAFNGLTLNLLIWPSHIATLSWMPWVVVTVEAAWRGGREKIVLAALVGTMQMLAGGPEIIFFTWLILLALWVQQMIRVPRDENGETAPPPHRAMLWRFLLMIVLVIALAAAQLLPFLDLVAHSQRESGYADLRWSMPGWGWANFLVPMAFGRTWTESVFLQYDQYWTSSYYLSLGTLWLALLAVWPARNRRVWLLGAIAVVALLCALGGNTPVYPALRKVIPQLSLITYPVKYLLFVSFIAPLLAAFALERLRGERSRLQGLSLRAEPKYPLTPSLSPAPRGGEGGVSVGEGDSENSRSKLLRRTWFIGGTLLALLAVVLFWTQRFPFPTDDPQAALRNGLSRVLFLLLTGGLLLVLARASSSRLQRIAAVVFILVAWLDVLTHEPTQNPTVPPWIYQFGLSRTKLALRPQPALGKSRTMVSPMAALEFARFAVSDPENNFLAKRQGYCGNCNLLDAVPKVDGFFSLTPRESDDVLSLFYTTTNADYPPLEDFLGVSQITASDEMFHWRARTNFLPLVTAGQRPVFLGDDDTLRALTQPGFDGSKIVLLPPEAKLRVTATNAATANIINPRFGTQSAGFEVEAAAPCLVVVAQTWYHDWKALVDGQSVPLLRANHAFQAMEIPAGHHRVQLIYRDGAFAWGAIISLLALLICAIYVLTFSRQQTTGS
jgi:hypothetical protein